MHISLHKLFLIISMMLVSFAGLNISNVASARTSLNTKGLSYANVSKLVGNESFAALISSKQVKVQSKEVQADSALSTNSLKVWENSTGEVLLTLNLKDANQYIEITVWNMLGKVVIYDYKGKYSGLEKEHVITNGSSLARGAYLVRMTGNKCKLDAKFIKTK